MTQALLEKWEFISQLGITSSHTKEESFKISSMNKLLGIALLSSLIIIPLELVLSTYKLAFVLMGLVPIILFSLYLCKRQKHQMAWHIVLFFATLITVISPFFASPAPFNVLFLFNAFIINIFLFDNKSSLKYYFGFYLLAMLAFCALCFQTEGIDQISNPILFNSLTVFINCVIAFIIIRLFLKEKEDSLQEAQYNLSLTQATLNATMNGLVVINQKGQIDNFNQRLITLWNIPDRFWEKTNAENLFDFLAEQLENPDQLLRDKLLYRDITNDTVFFEELVLKNGRVFEYHSHPQFLQGKLIGRVVNFRDISESRKAQQLLEQSESRFRSIFKNSPIGIAVGENKTNPMRHVNPSFCKMLGYTEEELKNLEVNDITYVKDRNIQDKPKEEALAGDQSNFSLQKRYIKKSGELIWANVNIGVITNDSGKYIGDVVLIEDITEKTEKEEQISSLVEQLQNHNDVLETEVQKRTQRLQKINTELVRSNEDLEQFAYVASHDLQEPLRMVGNFVQLLEKQYNDQLDEEGKSYISFAVDGVSRMSDLIQNLLKYSRVGKKDIAFREINICDLIELKLLGLSQKIEETQTAVSFPKSNCKIFCEPNQVGIVFYNLINNALKFNQKEERKIDIGWEEREEDWCFYVKDNGIGIDEKYKQKVFEIFKRLNRREEYEGTGIGLALCKKIINRHKGSIWLESVVGEGATFYFTIHKELQNELQLRSHSDSISRG